jgi:hypothetical protein
LEIVASYFDLPCIRPSIMSFRRNYNSIIETALAANVKPILFTYAFYQPINYSYQRFKNGELDYANTLFPTELYGNPNCIPNGIRGHNRVIREMAKKLGSSIIYLNFEAILNKKGENFIDICHLTFEGCGVLSQSLTEIIN